MANKLDITTLFTDGSARCKSYTVDPKGTLDTNAEIVLYWPELDINKIATIGAAMISQAETVINSVVCDGNVAYGDAWYLAGQPTVKENNERTAMLVVTLTKSVGLAGEDFPYENRSDTAFYNSAIYKGYTETRKGYQNAKTAPTMDDPLDGNAAITTGSLTRRKNKYGRWDGVATNRTYAGVGSYNPSANDEIIGYKMWMQTYRSSEGDRQSVFKIVRTDKKYFANSQAGREGAQVYADQSDDDPVQSQSVELGNPYFDEGVQLYVGLRTQLHIAGTTYNSARFTNDAGP